mmetsp:Transcript_25836/g.41401  ORF Transcript_25836/g.41401 Transcript_25836/m.41401 type:complete len:99 (+) Transcript_25836:312-608(+)
MYSFAKRCPSVCAYEHGSNEDYNSTSSRLTDQSQNSSQSFCTRSLVMRAHCDFMKSHQSQFRICACIFKRVALKTVLVLGFSLQSFEIMIFSCWTGSA